MQTFKTFCLFICTLLFFLLLMHFFSGCSQTGILQHVEAQYPHCNVAVVRESAKHIEIMVACPGYTPILKSYAKR